MRVIWGSHGGHMGSLTKKTRQKKEKIIPGSVFFIAPSIYLAMTLTLRTNVVLHRVRIS